MADKGLAVEKKVTNLTQAYTVPFDFSFWFLMGALVCKALWYYMLLLSLCFDGQTHFGHNPNAIVLYADFD